MTFRTPELDETTRRGLAAARAALAQSARRNTQPMIQPNTQPSKEPTP